MSTNGDNIHLLPLVGYDVSDGSSVESEEEDPIEVVSNVDEKENVWQAQEYRICPSAPTRVAGRFSKNYWL